ncbi:hypothetical protein DPMN_061554 [Dreissena polymorpha]|uniref:Sushi domain-containing protein n=1 Tax=Dreissena polymorpha TaxID=45954 RepID=A0A9D4C791_DREPO|nr:hypothetical protein DPMN_061554 [Dreissena polymorpha]
MYFVASDPLKTAQNPPITFNSLSLICTADCGDPTPNHGTVNTTATTYGTVVKISCNHGYVLSGTSIIKCNADSAWSESATCNPYGKEVLCMIQPWNRSDC